LSFEPEQQDYEVKEVQVEETKDGVLNEGERLQAIGSLDERSPPENRGSLLNENPLEPERTTDSTNERQSMPRDESQACNACQHLKQLAMVAKRVIK
jgi:hypothetical protein